MISIPVLAFVHMKAPRIPLFVAVVAIPLVLLAFGAWRGGRLGNLLNDQAGLLMNWLFMLAPHAIAVLIAGVFRAARRRFLPWCLLALSGALVAFQGWIWTMVPAREGALAWLLYLPLSALVIATVALLAWRLHRDDDTLPPARSVGTKQH